MRRTFTYRLPPGFAADVKAGARLLVPFGKRAMTGYAVALHATLDEDLGISEESLKDVSELLDEQPLVTSEILRLTQWTADYYAMSWGDMLKASLPAGINSANERLIRITKEGRDELVGNSQASTVRNRLLEYLRAEGETPQRDIEKVFGEESAKRSIREVIAAGHAEAAEHVVTTKVRAKLRKSVSLLESNADRADEKPLTQIQQRAVDTLAAAGGTMLFTELLDRADIGASAINTLAKRGVVEVSVQEVRRDPLADLDTPKLNEIELNAEQQAALKAIESGMSANDYSAFLLHGITGSGKTEVYIRAMRLALERGRSALMLVPEIALTPIFSRRLRSVFGEEVAILHSNLSAGERFDEWRRIRSGKARIAIGTRSAVFAPLENIGLLIVDEEHDASYRQHEAPFYNARDVAVMRAKFAGAAVVLGSATPALESFQNAKSGKYEYLRLPNRIGDVPLAQAELIDMRDVFRDAGRDVALSPQLLKAIAETHAKGEQSIILLNRRGFSQFVLCRSCGESLRCKNCDITLTFHRGRRQLVCHYCGHNVGVPNKCPFCKSEFLYFIGKGTEQLEVMLNKQFPDLRIARIDRDSMTRKGVMAKTLLAFDRGEIDMLVGTQMLAKGHDFHNVTLVGVISVDTGLGLPDFRSAERTFQLLTQVAGRAGRGRLQGRVLIQTYYPEHYALKHACNQDFEGFYDQEIRYRQRLSYPPFVALASILIKHKDLDHAAKSAGLLKEALDRANTGRSCRILGVAPASLSKLKGEYRLQILLKSADRRELRDVLDIGLAEAATHGCELKIVHVEIDPVNLM